MAKVDRKPTKSLRTPKNSYSRPLANRQTSKPKTGRKASPKK